MDRIRQLIDRAVEGDEAAARELVRHAQPAVWRLCHLLGSGEDVEDLVQETFLRALRSLAGYRGDGRGFVPWVLAVARNACATEVGRRMRRRALLERLQAVRGAEESYGLDEHATVESMVRVLPREQREAFVLTQFLGLSYEESAAICGCPVGTIRSRVARARTALLAQLQQRCS